MLRPAGPVGLVAAPPVAASGRGEETSVRGTLDALPLSLVPPPPLSQLFTSYGSASETGQLCVAVAKEPGRLV